MKASTVTYAPREPMANAAALTIAAADTRHAETIRGATTEEA